MMGNLIGNGNCVNGMEIVPKSLLSCLCPSRPNPLSLQFEEGQHWLRAYVRGGAHRHQKLSPHQRTDVGPGGQVHSRRQARTAQPLKQVRHELMQHICQGCLKLDT